jgi:hypothetical protein
MQPATVAPSSETAKSLEFMSRPLGLQLIPSPPPAAPSIARAATRAPAGVARRRYLETAIGAKLWYPRQPAHRPRKPLPTLENRPPGD